MLPISKIRQKHTHFASLIKNYRQTVTSIFHFDLYGKNVGKIELYNLPENFSSINNLNIYIQHWKEKKRVQIHHGWLFGR